MSNEKTDKNEQDRASKIKTRIGVWMFILYTLVYSGFIFITVTNPELMGADIGYLNLAIVYGLGLIVFALVLALIYNFLCTKYEKKLNSTQETDTEGENEL